MSIYIFHMLQLQVVMRLKCYPRQSVNTKWTKGVGSYQVGCRWEFSETDERNWCNVVLSPPPSSWWRFSRSAERVTNTRQQALRQQDARPFSTRCTSVGLITSPALCTQSPGGQGGTGWDRPFCSKRCDTAVAFLSPALQSDLLLVRNEI